MYPLAAQHYAIFPLDLQENTSSQQSIPESGNILFNYGMGTQYPRVSGASSLFNTSLRKKIISGLPHLFQVAFKMTNRRRIRRRAKMLRSGGLCYALGNSNGNTIVISRCRRTTQRRAAGGDNFAPERVSFPDALVDPLLFVGVTCLVNDTHWSYTTRAPYQ